MIALKSGEDFDTAEVDLGAGTYKVSSVVVVDQYAGRTRAVSNVPFVRDVRMDLEFTIDSNMLGKRTNFEFAPQKINDFTVTRYKTI